MGKKPDVPISDNHRRGITATLGLLDEMLCRFERWIAGQRAEGVLYRELDTLTADQRSAIRAEIEHLRKALTGLRDDLRLEIKTEDIAGAIWSQSSAFREALVELGTRYLRRYGEVPEGFARYFDPQVERMIEHVARIADAAARGQAGCGKRRRSPASDADDDPPKAKTHGRR